MRCLHVRGIAYKGTESGHPLAAAQQITVDPGHVGRGRRGGQQVLSAEGRPADRAEAGGHHGAGKAGAGGCGSGG